jgi:C_GCAxxG_C_C family probable redox protein
MVGRKLPRKPVPRKAYELGLKYERNCQGCCQAVLAAVQDVFNIQNNDVLKSATALSGGLADSTDGTCGALAAGVMAIGLLHGRGRDHLHEPQFGYESYVLGKKLRNRFIEEYGSCLCREILMKIFGRTFDFWDPEELEQFEALGGHDDKCPVVVAKSAMWTAEILLKAKHAKNRPNKTT